MTKAIKFNLLIDEKSIRDISGLQENFCIGDILEVYDKGLLEKWLEVRGFNEYLYKLQQIDKSKSVIVQLIKIFDIKKDDKEIQKAIYSLEFEKERKQILFNLQKLDKNLQDTINKYHDGYDHLKKEIVKKRNNIEYLKTASKEMSDNYIKLFELDYHKSYYFFKEQAPLFIYTILMNDKLKELLLKENLIKKDLIDNFVLDTATKINDFLYKFFDIFKELENNKEINPNKISESNEKLIQQHLGSLFGILGNQINYKKQLLDKSERGLNEELLTQIKEYINIVEFQGVTDNYWKDLETVDTKVMIISIPKGTYITNPNNTKEELSSDDVKGNFLIIDGLVYKSNVTNLPIVYMKV